VFTTRCFKPTECLCIFTGKNVVPACGKVSKRKSVLDSVTHVINAIQTLSRVK
jgi:hypothetical protein